jgi:hypothetical protein
MIDEFLLIMSDEEPPFFDTTEQVTGLDRSWQRPAGVAAKLIDSRASNGMYYIEYTLQKPGDKRRHIVSAIGMAFNGWYNRLYTITGQVIRRPAVYFHFISSSAQVHYTRICSRSRVAQYFDDDEESAKYKPQIEKVRSSWVESASFRFMILMVVAKALTYFLCLYLQSVKSFKFT